jgi:hypothetical protein
MIDNKYTNSAKAFVNRTQGFFRQTMVLNKAVLPKTINHKIFLFSPSLLRCQKLNK